MTTTPAAKDIFDALTGELTLSHVSRMVENNISLWQQCVPEELKTQVREMASSFKFTVSMFPNSMICKWIVDSRPDLRPVLDNDKGYIWLESLVNELRTELWQ
jgi:hypothetical protein